MLLPIILLIGLVVFLSTDLRHFLSFERLAREYSDLNAFVLEDIFLAMLAFTILYGLVVALSLPAASFLTLIGGAVFGWPAILLILIGATSGACVVFLAARNFMTAFFKARTSGFMARLETGFKEDSFAYLLALRLIPAAPFWVVNIVPALLGMGLRPFAFATFVGIAPGTAVYVWVGRGFDKILAQGNIPDLASLKDPYILAPLVLLGVLSLLPVLVKRLKKTKQHEHR